METQQYQSPLTSRYASPEMLSLFSPHFKYTTWRKLWVALAEGQKAGGLPITEAQVASLKAHIYTLNLDVVTEIEKQVRHDVMAHIHAYGQQCPEAKGIIHLGATSCYVTDNTDLLQMKEGLKILRNKIIQVIRQLQAFALRYAHLPTLSFTHFQAAQPTTVGKRACLWLQDLLFDLHDIEYALEQIRFLGLKGATGTQASFLALFDGNHEKVVALEAFIAKEMDFSSTLSVAGQTYTRKQDIRITSTLSSFAASAHKLATDIRLLAHLKEIEEPFANTQVGSSAMPYKRNPMRCERICGLARFVLSLQDNALYTEATQWLERSLDDSSNRRLYLPEIFLCTDAILNLLCDLTAHLTLYPKMIEYHLAQEMPFLVTEELLMAAVKKGKDRQQVHERLRMHSQAAGQRIKAEGLPNDLVDRIATDPLIGLTLPEIQSYALPEKTLGRSKEQVYAFLNQEIAPILKKYQSIKPYIPHLAV